MVVRSGPTVSPSPVVPVVLRWRDRRREQQRLARQDRLGAHLAELRRIGELVADARALVGSGWVQGRWLVHRDADGRLREVVGRDREVPVSGACLVGSLVQAGGGVAALGTQPVQRALDATWHALHGDPGAPVRWCPAPPVRLQHVRDLAGWNDAAGRTRDEVVGLLHAAERLVVAETARGRAAAGSTAAGARHPG